MRRTLAVLSAFALLACSGLTPVSGSLSSSVNRPPKASPNPRLCADLLAQAETSAHAPVVGTFNCFDQALRVTLNGAGIFDDQDFTTFVAAVPPTLDHREFCGVAANGSLIYEVTNSTDATIGFRLVVTNDVEGQVAGFNLSPGAACPKLRH